jgi:hypothetical protein
MNGFCGFRCKLYCWLPCNPNGRTECNERWKARRSSKLPDQLEDHPRSLLALTRNVLSNINVLLRAKYEDN